MTKREQVAKAICQAETGSMLTWSIYLTAADAAIDAFQAPLPATTRRLTSSGRIELYHVYYRRRDDVTTRKWGENGSVEDALRARDRCLGVSWMKVAEAWIVDQDGLLVDRRVVVDG